MTKFQKIFLTFFYSGLSPKAPGTMGTLASLPLGILFLEYLGFFPFLAIIFITTAIAINIVDIYEAKSGTHDNQKIVIDETVGVWLTMVITSLICNDIIIITILSFIFFRIYDITKPLIIGKIDDNIPGGKGVILDDIVAGIFAGITNILIYSIYLLIWVV